MFGFRHNTEAVAPLDECVQLVLTLPQEGAALLQHTADVVHLHGQNLVHVLLLHALLTDQVQHLVALLQRLHIHE